RFNGKRAMCSLTVGGPAEAYTEAGAYASIEQILFPIHRGIFAFTGFMVIEPFVVYGPNRISEGARREQLKRYRARVLSLDTAPLIASPT
ncbi:NAD(P)H-dependent oxidoreductase, partial [Enterococcus casseliflavus]|uniref:NAD(P)H-dependent oxidoreductase n=1 Tax=Enterococcus casseliflavus TaxID=37734 RepID=UPI003D12844C